MRVLPTVFTDHQEGKALVVVPKHANRLLEAMPDGTARRVRAACQAVELGVGEVLYTPATPVRHVYFPTRGFIALIMPIGTTASIEVGLIGNEGMLGIPLVLGVEVSRARAVVQGAGTALRMGAGAFRRELGGSPALRSAVNRYAFVHLSHLAQAAGCTRFHVVEARLARWLLMTQDRAHADDFHVTQEMLAVMLGVRRVGITKAASSLQARGLIRYNRGHITVLDRRGLKAASCDCYQADRDCYARTLR